MNESKAMTHSLVFKTVREEGAEIFTQVNRLIQTRHQSCWLSQVKRYDQGLNWLKSYDQKELIWPANR